MDFRHEGLCLYYRDTLKTLQCNTSERTEHTARAVVEYAVTSYRLILSDDDLVEDILEVADVPEWVKDQWREQTGPVLVASQQITLKETPFRPQRPEEDPQPKEPVFEVRCNLSTEKRGFQRRTDVLRHRIHELGRETHHGPPSKGENPLQKFTERAGDRLRVCPLQTQRGSVDAECLWIAGRIRAQKAREAKALSQQKVWTEIPPRGVTSLNMSVVSVRVGGATFRLDG